jgi:hypothetical protein
MTMASIHDLPDEMLDYLLSYFVFTDPWQSMLLVCKKWQGIVLIYARIRKQEWRDYLDSLTDRFELYNSFTSDLSLETRANGLYDAFLEAAHLPEKHFGVRDYFRQLVMVYSNAHSTYNSMRLKHLLASLIRRLDGEIVILMCSTFYKDSLDPDPHVAALAIRQMTDFSLKKCPMFQEYAFQTIKSNIVRNSFECESASLFNLSKLVHLDELWSQVKEDNILHYVVPPNLIPSYAILAAEMKKVNRIEIVAKYFSVNQIVDHYHTWNLWQRNAVLQLIARNIHSVIDSSEYMTLIEFLMALIIDMCSNRELIATNCGEFFNVVDVLGHFCTTQLKEEILGTRLLKLLADTMVLFQYDYPHLTEVVHGFLVKIRQLILFMKYDGTADPDLVENFFSLWCDDSAIKKRKLWFVRQLACQQNVTSVKFELEQLVNYEENLTIQRLAQDILEGVKRV